MIVIAVLGLLILVVLIFVFSNKINIFGKSVSNCGGSCVQITTSASDACDTLSRDGKIFTNNPSGVCSQNPKTGPQTHACCILAYNP